MIRHPLNLNETIIDQEIEEERKRSSIALNKLRLVAIIAFFVFHIFMGYYVNATSFRGKELFFLTHLGIALSLFFLPSQNITVQFLRKYSIALFDIPVTYLLLRSWLQVLNGSAAQHLLSALGLSFMIFIINMSGLLFSKRVTVPASVVALFSVLDLFSRTNPPPHIMGTAAVLVGISCYTSITVSTRLKNLVRITALKQSANEKFFRYFTPEVAAAIQNNEGVLDSWKRTVDVTVIFTDIRDFTRITSKISDTQAIDLLNEIHEHLVSCIFLTGGTLDKYLGDGVMAYFGAPVKSENHAQKAIECALMMRSEIEIYNKKRTARGAEPIHIGIGINTGPAIIGDIGAEIRREFTIIGDTVNTASRIESLTKYHHVDILLTSTTRERIAATVHDEAKYSFRSLGRNEIRGSGVTLEVFTIEN